jgi:ribosomal protein S18 acetylase RimI-like enzyme
VDDVSLALSHSLCLGFEQIGRDREDPRLAGFARVVSDRAFKALILDVVVAPEQRSSGLGRRLVRSLIAHPELRRVKHFELYCATNMGPYYERLGFEHLKLSFMRLNEAGRAAQPDDGYEWPRTATPGVKR